MYGIKTFTILFVIFVILLLAPVTDAKLIDNPEAVSYMHVNLVKDGNVVIKPEGPLARATDLTVYISIPQDSTRQKSVLQEVDGPDSYEMEKDQWENDVLKLTWDSPPLDENIAYSATFDVKVYDRLDPAQGKEPQSTDMNKANLEMTETAYNLVQGMNDIEKVFRLTQWVYEWIDYDDLYEDLPKSAAWVYDNKKGICSGYSNLLISMLKTLGFNAYYVIGYAYTEETPGTYWGPHGWVEVEYDGKIIPLDPTWLEAPVDGTHIKFANSHDSEYREKTEVLGSHVKLIWTREEPKIELIEKTDSPRIEIETELIPEQSGSDSYSLLITEISSTSSWGCLLSNLELQSCVIGNKDFVDIPKKTQTINFCGNDTLYWFLKTPVLQSHVAYTCPVYLTGAGALEKPEVNAMGGPKNIEVIMNTPKVLTPNEVFRVDTILENHGFARKSLKTFLILGDEVQEQELTIDAGYQGKITWTLKAPPKPGSKKLSFFSSSGNLIEEDLTVISKRNVKIQRVSLPDNITFGNEIVINVTVKGMERIIGEIELRIEEEIQTRDFDIDKDEVKNFVFSYVPQADGNKEISILLFSGGRYEDGMIGNLLVMKESGILEMIFGAVMGFFGWVGSLIGF